ncbi:MAG: ATP-binding protein [Gemmatimonadaceae bacterium]|nr:ATP-binding protein [Gemmatimonadaceae bacterium]
MAGNAFVARPHPLAKLRAALRRSPVVALLGPRQSGKTTTARLILPADSPNYFDLEDPQGLARLEQPMTALAELRGTVVIDEIQRRPELFPVLRVLADRHPRQARFLVLGSASPDLLRQSSESLAGRMETLTIGGFRLDELGENALMKHWRRGGFPVAYLARTETNSLHWREQFVRTLLERDLPQLGVRIPSTALLRFWTMLAHYHGNIWNAAEPARSLGISQPTVRQYLDLLTDVFMLRQLQPWHENLLKRQVKAPKIYVRDTGLLHQLLGIRTERDLMTHPKLGSSWEGYAVEEVIKLTEPDHAYYWATHAGAELDLLLFKNGRRYGVEIKREDAPRLTPSMRIALEDLKLDHLSVLYPGERSYTLGPRVSVIPLRVVGKGGPRAIPRILVGGIR